MKKIYVLVMALFVGLLVFNASAQKAVLFVGGNDPLDAEDQHIVDSMTGWGYTVTTAEDGNFNSSYTDIAAFDGIDAVVLGESISSNNGAPIQTIDYAIPVLNMEGYTPRSDKWGWVPWVEGTEENFWNSNKTPDVDGLSVIVTDNAHYITEGYNLDEEVVYSTEPAPTGEQVAMDLTSITGAVPLAKSKSAFHAGKHVMWAIPEGTMLPGALADVPAKRMLIFALHKNNHAAEVVTEGFYNLIKRSLAWVLGAESTVAVNNVLAESGVKLLTNPVRDYGTISFNLNEPGNVSISVFNLIGQQTILKSNESYSAGNNEISFSTSELNAGIYLYQMKVNNSIYSGKMHVVK